MDNNEVKLPDFLIDLIRDEKKEGTGKFQSLDFEKKIYNRIRDQKRGRKIFSKWILVPASLILIVISAFFLFKESGKDLSGINKFQIVLESVINESLKPKELSSEILEKQEIFENIQNKIFTSVRNTKIGENNLSKHITSSLISASGKKDQKFNFSEKNNGDDFLYIKEDIANMNKKDDYSELFSRIIINLTEG